MFLHPASFGCATGQSDHTMKSQNGEGTASRSNGSVPGRRLRLSANRALGRERSGNASRWVSGTPLLRPRVSSAASGVSVVSLLLLPALRPGLISARSGPAVPVSLSVQKSDLEAGVLSAHAPPASLGSEVMGKVELGQAPGTEVSGQKKWTR